MIHFVDSNLKPHVIFEVGCGNIIETRSSYMWKYEDITFYLFEPNRKFYYELIKMIGKLKNVYVFNCAILDIEKDVELVDAGACGYIKGYEGAPITRGGTETDLVEKNNPVYTVKALPLSYFDKGNIDILYIDTEGSEIFGLKSLVSRPAFINIEMEVDGRNNLHYDKIMNWMNLNGYRVAEKCGNDIIFTNIYFRTVKLD